MGHVLWQTINLVSSRQFFNGLKSLTTDTAETFAQMAGVPFHSENFIGSNSALFPGQALANIYQIYF